MTSGHGTKVLVHNEWKEWNMLGSSVFQLIVATILDFFKELLSGSILNLIGFGEGSTDEGA